MILRRGYNNEQQLDGGLDERCDLSIAFLDYYRNSPLNYLIEEWAEGIERCNTSPIPSSDMASAIENLFVRIIWSGAIFVGVWEIGRWVILPALFHQPSLDIIYCLALIISGTIIWIVVTPQPRETLYAIGISLFDLLSSIPGAIFGFIGRIWNIIRRAICRIICGQINDKGTEIQLDDRICWDCDKQGFENSYGIISRNAHYLLIGIGLVLTLFVVVAQGWLGKDANQIINQINNTAESFLSVQISGTSQELPQSDPYLWLDVVMGMLLVGFAFLSALSCVRCFDSGLYLRMEKNDVLLSELKEREKRALKHYYAALMCYCITLVVLVSLIGVTFVGTAIGKSIGLYIFSYFLISVSVIASVMTYLIGIRKRHFDI